VHTCVSGTSSSSHSHTANHGIKRTSVANVSIKLVSQSAQPQLELFISWKEWLLCVHVGNLWTRRGNSCVCQAPTESFVRSRQTQRSALHIHKQLHCNHSNCSSSHKQIPSARQHRYDSVLCTQMFPFTCLLTIQHLIINMNTRTGFPLFCHV